MKHRRNLLRFWKSRCRAGEVIPLHVIVEYRLGRWFAFEPVSTNAETYRAVSL
jgi:hypothetical protein